MNLPPGTIVHLALKGTERVVIGAVVGPYTRDSRPSVLIDTADGSAFPMVAVALATIADGYVVGGVHDNVVWLHGMLDRFSHNGEGA